MKPVNKAVFFDRDDTLIKDVPYNGDPDVVELMPGALAETHGMARPAANTSV